MFLKIKAIFIKIASEHFLDLKYLMIPKVHFTLQRESLCLGRVEIFIHTMCFPSAAFDNLYVACQYLDFLRNFFSGDIRTGSFCNEKNFFLKS